MMEGPRHRCICVKCREHFASPVKFSLHLAECDEAYDVNFIMELLRVDQTGDCWLMDDPRGAKYVPKFGVAPKKTLKVHEIIAIAVNGERPDGLMLCHWCDNRKCLRPEHLYWGTARDNSKDAWRNQRRSMSQAQLDAMHAGLKTSEKNKERMVRHNRELGIKHRGDAHWTRRDPEAMQRWIDAMKQGRQAHSAKRGGDADDD